MDDSNVTSQALNATDFSPQHFSDLVNNTETSGIMVDGLRIFSGKKTILNLNNFSFPSKGVVAVMGPSGCGKSSLLKVMANLHNECIGFDGQIDVRCCDQEKAIPSSRFAMIWQQPTVFPCSVWDNLKIPLRKRRIAKSQWRQKMIDALTQTGLLEELGEQWWKRRADCLSGGQKQRLCIAMGLLKDADIMLFDEPTSALDPISTEKVERIIESLGKTKLVILVTHSIGQARRMSQYTAMFANKDNCGELCEFGSTEKVFNNPSSVECRNFIMHETGL